MQNERRRRVIGQCLKLHKFLAPMQTISLGAATENAWSPIVNRRAPIQKRTHTSSDGTSTTWRSSVDMELRCANIETSNGDLMSNMLRAPSQWWLLSCAVWYDILVLAGSKHETNADIQHRAHVQQKQCRQSYESSSVETELNISIVAGMFPLEVAAKRRAGDCALKLLKTYFLMCVLTSESRNMPRPRTDVDSVMVVGCWCCRPFGGAPHDLSSPHTAEAAAAHVVSGTRRHLGFYRCAVAGGSTEPLIMDVSGMKVQTAALTYDHCLKICRVMFKRKSIHELISEYLHMQRTWPNDDRRFPCRERVARDQSSVTGAQ